MCMCSMPIRVHPPPLYACTHPCAPTCCPPTAHTCMPAVHAPPTAHSHVCAHPPIAHYPPISCPHCPRMHACTTHSHMHAHYQQTTQVCAHAHLLPTIHAPHTIHAPPTAHTLPTHAHAYCPYTHCPSVYANHSSSHMLLPTTLPLPIVLRAGS